MWLWIKFIRYECQWAFNENRDSSFLKIQFYQMSSGSFLRIHFWSYKSTIWCQVPDNWQFALSFQSSNNFVPYSPFTIWWFGTFTKKMTEKFLQRKIRQIIFTRSTKNSHENKKYPKLTFQPIMNSMEIFR